MTTNTVRGAVEKRKEDADKEAARLSDVKNMLDKMSPEIARALPRHMTGERMARILFTQIRYTPKLALCSDQSLAGAILTCAQLGMEPGPTGEAWILPYWNTNTRSFEAQFQLGYKGMAKLFWQHPLALYLDAQTVYEYDQFDYEYGLDAYLKHKPGRGERGKPSGEWYAVAKLTNGGFRFVVLGKDKVEEHRRRSQSPDSPAWKNHYNEMACKTCVRVMFHLLPKSAEIERAVALDGTVRNVDEMPSLTATDLIDGEAEDLAVDTVTGEVIDAEPDDGDPLAYDELSDEQRGGGQ